MDADARARARRTAHATKGRGYGLFLLAAVGASLCFALSRDTPAALAVGAVLVLVSARVAIRVEAWLRAMDPARRSRLVSTAGFAGLLVALVFPFVLPPAWSILLTAPGAGGPRRPRAHPAGAGQRGPGRACGDTPGYPRRLTAPPQV